MSRHGAFVLGSARCGSTLVSEILRLHPDLLSLSELFSTAGPRAFAKGQISGAQFWQGLARPDPLGAQIANPVRAPNEFLYGCQEGNRYDPFNCPPLLCVTLPHLSERPDDLFEELSKKALTWTKEPIESHYQALFDDLAQRFQRRVWVERSGGSLVAAQSLRQMFPTARFVLLTRAGPETVLSLCDYPAARLAVYIWQRLAWLGVDLLSPNRHYGRGRIWQILQKFSFALPVKRIIDTPPDPVQVAAFWSAMMINGSRALQDLPGQHFMHLCYEDLVADPGPQISRLGHFLAGNAPAGWVARAAALPKARPLRSANLGPDQLQRLTEACAPGEAAVLNLLQRQAQNPAF